MNDYEEKCPCLGCTVIKIRNAVTSPIQDIESAMKAIFKWNNSFTLMITNFSDYDRENYDKIKEYIDLIETDLTNDISQVMYNLDLLELQCDYYSKQEDMKRSKDIYLNGTPKIKIKDQIKRHYDSISNMPTIFDSGD